MKKILLCFAFIAFCAGAVVAEKTKVHGFGISVPIENQLWHNDDILKDESFFNVGLNLDYKNMCKHGDGIVGFSAIYEMQLGYFWGSTDNTDYNWFDVMNFKWGWGIAFRPTEKIILATHGTVGFDFKLLWDMDDNPPFPDFTTRTGWDFVFVYKAGEKVGICLGLDTYVPLFGIGLDHYKEMKLDKYSGEYEEEKSVESYKIYSGFGCDFKIGICWVY